MDKQKQIEEIQKLLEYCCNEYDEKGRHIRNKCNSWDCEYYDETNGVCASYGLKEAKALYDASYRKIPENAVVLTREEYNELEDLRLNHAKDLIDANELYEERIADTKLEYDNHIKNLEKIIDRQSTDLNSQANRLLDLKSELENSRKETAEKIFKALFESIRYCDDAGFELLEPEKVIELAKQFGVKIKE